MENNKERTTVVFGGSGLVGSHLKADLKPTRAEVDLRNIDEIREFFNKNEFDTIVNCAGNVGGLGKNMDSNLEMFMSNMEMNMNLFKVIIQVFFDTFLSFYNGKHICTTISFGVSILTNSNT